MIILKFMATLFLICFLAALTLSAAAGIIHLLLCEIEIDEEHKSFKARLWIEKRNFLLKLAGVFGILTVFLFITISIITAIFLPVNG